MDRISVRSSTVKSVGYEEASRTLEVEFHSGGLYQYLDVPGEVLPQFLASSSKGKFLDARIKGTYRFRKLR